MRCEIPSPYASLEQAERYDCADVERLSDKTLLAETFRMQYCIAENEKEAWFWKRWQAVREEIERRRQNERS